VDPESFLPRHRLVQYWSHHTGALGIDSVIESGILSAMDHGTFDLVYVDGGQFVSPRVIATMRKRCDRIVNYNIDNPFGGRDGRKWRLYLKSVPFYDLLVVVREENVDEAQRCGAKSVLRVYRSADEVAHAPREMTTADMQQWKSEVLFIGTQMPERGPFLSRLVELGVPLSIRGNRWARAKEWQQLRPYWRGSGIYEDDYAKAIQGADVSLGMLSKENRDLHTTRSLEIPYLGGLLCAERTREHCDLYREGEEAVFWSSADECAEKCFALLNDAGLRRRIADSGRLRCIQNRTTNEAVMRRIVEEACKPRQVDLASMSAR
jgi:hypothetical protein